MTKILLHLWQLPQHLVAWAIIATETYTYRETYKGRRVYVKSTTGATADGIGLGNYIFVEEKVSDEPHIAHEYGHCRQSLRLGWLYLLTVGIVSAAIPYDGARRYEAWPESWANRLGGVRVVRTGPLLCNFKLEMI